MADKGDIKDALEGAMGMDEDEKIAKALLNVVEELRSPDDVDYFTRLTEEDISNLTVIETFDDEISRTLAEKYKSLKVSQNRRGRKELVDLVKGLGNIKNNEDEGKLDKIRQKLG